MIKIAQVRWCEPTGGVERMLRDLAVYLDRGQFDMRFFFLARGGPHENELRTMGYPMTIIPARSGYDLRMRQELVRQLQSFQPHIVHEHGIPPLVWPLIKWTIDGHLISFEHGGVEINRRKGKPWLNWLRAVEYKFWSESVIVNSAANRRLVMEAYRLPPSKVQVISLGTDLGNFQTSELSRTRDQASDLILGYVGRLQNYDKGTDFLPQLAQQLLIRGFRSFKLQIVGDGPDRVAIQELAEQLGVADWLEFLGRRENIPELMSGMDILIVPSRLEAFGLVALEALAMETRVVAFAVEALTETLGQCTSVRLVPPGDVSALAEAVLDLWKKHGKSRANEGRLFVSERFDARRMTHDLEQIYLQIMRQEKQ
jgi:glycosyltransferase involved in cell wall biosynthesis